ncbi:MAG: ZIP family metal transporter [Chloroflexi bacterium]|nr:ZIP family metal transporter [Chloroflexota bacterium]
MTEWVYSLSSALLVSLISLIGVVTLMLGVKKLERVIPLLISMAVGGLFTDAFVHLLPEAFERSTSPPLTSLYALIGVMVFFLLERYLHWHHEHRAQVVNPIHPVAYVNLVSDAVHNFLDGLIIGAAYLASVPAGVATTIAVALHEIPQEQGDFAILVNAGFTPKRALMMNFLSASLAILGVVVSLVIGPNVTDYTLFMLPLAAGGFIYIAGSDLIPELHRETGVISSLSQVAVMVTGGGMIYALLLLD